MAHAGALGNGYSGANRTRRIPATFFARRRTQERLSGLALAVLLHAAAIGALLQFEIVRNSIIQAAPIMIRFITPPKVEEPPKPIEAPKRVELPSPKPIAKPVPPLKKPVPPPPEPAMKAIDTPAPIEPAEPQQAPEPRPVEARSSAPAPAPVTQTAAAPPDFSAAYLHNPTPVYPAQSRRRQEQGTVRLRVYVSATGSAEKVEIATSSGWPRLDDAAQQTVRSWRFVPARQADKAVSAWVIVPIKFSLEG